MFTASFGACATTVNVGGNGMTQVGNLTGVNTVFTDDSSAVSIGALKTNAKLKVPVRYLAVIYNKVPGAATSYTLTGENRVYKAQMILCSQLDNKPFDLGNRTNIYAKWQPLFSSLALLVAPSLHVLRSSNDYPNLVSADFDPLNAKYSIPRGLMTAWGQADWFDKADAIKDQNTSNLGIIRNEAFHANIQNKSKMADNTAQPRLKYLGQLGYASQHEICDGTSKECSDLADDKKMSQRHQMPVCATDLHKNIVGNSPSDTSGLYITRDIVIQ